jgi:hypothetical protein
VVFNPDGIVVATASNDRSARVNLHRAQDPIESALSRGSRDLTLKSGDSLIPAGRRMGDRAIGLLPFGSTETEATQGRRAHGVSRLCPGSWR